MLQAAERQAAALEAMAKTMENTKKRGFSYFPHFCAVPNERFLFSKNFSCPAVPHQCLSHASRNWQEELSKFFFYLNPLNVKGSNNVVCVIYVIYDH